MNFEEANKVVHKVETQWHYPIMIGKGFKSLTKEGIGFVRSYRYEKGDHMVTCTTGANADHWSDNKGNSGYWGTLKDL